ncbi:MAG: DUF4198 domain-containing protein [Pseudomonadota bacterium]
MSIKILKKSALLAVVATASLAASPTSQADVGFLLPNTFQIAEDGRVTVIASFSDRFPGTEHPLRSDDFHIVTPDGKRASFSSVDQLTQMTVLGARLTDPGVYKLSSGERLGRKGKASRIDGALVRVGRDGMDASDLPEDAPIYSAQTATVSEAYIRRGEVAFPQTLAADGRLTIRLTAKDGYAPGAPLRVAVLFDGAPAPNAALTLVAPYDAYTENPEGVVIQADENGYATLVANRAGPHVIYARRMAEAPADAETNIRSYTTALIFEIAGSGAKATSE